MDIVEPEASKTKSLVELAVDALVGSIIHSVKALLVFDCSIKAG
jgi:hypothetical protein